MRRGQLRCHRDGTVSYRRLDDKYVSRVAVIPSGDLAGFDARTVARACRHLERHQQAELGPGDVIPTAPRAAREAPGGEP